MELIVNAVVEIPKGSKLKLEFHEDELVLDRVLKIPFPQNYGFIPNTTADDGDALDVVVICDEDIPSGVHVKCKVVGLLEMIDCGEIDHKLLLVPHWNKNVETWKDLESHVIPNLKTFFETYKPHPKIVTIGQVRDIDFAEEVLRKSLKVDNLK